MINASNLNIANINGKPVIITTKSLLGNPTSSNIVIQGANSKNMINTKPGITIQKVIKSTKKYSTQSSNN